jgi:hypothetical protein
MKRKGIAILCIVLSWFAVRAQDSNAKKPANNFKSSDQLASVAKSRTSVVFNGKAKLQVDSPSSIQVFYFSDSSSSETKDNRDAVQ